MEAQTGFTASGEMVRPLTWGEWKKLKVSLLNNMQGIIGSIIAEFPSATTDADRMQFFLAALSKLEGFEELACSRAVSPVTDETPVGMAQIVRHQGGLQIVEAVVADANFIAGLAEGLGPLLAKAMGAVQSNSAQRSGGPG